MRQVTILYTEHHNSVEGTQYMDEAYALLIRCSHTV